MKKNKLYRFCAIFVLGISLLACSEDFLDKEQLGAKNINEFYTTDEEATAAVMGCYNYMRAMNSSIWTSLWMTKMSLSDEIYTGGENSGDRPEYQELNTFTFGPTNSPISNTFSYAYRVILRANLIVDNFSDNPTEYQKLVVAEAKVIRSFMYLELASLYGTPPLVLHQLNTKAEYAQPNSTQEELYNQIIKDCSEAAEVLPYKNEMSAKGMDIARMSKGTALAFKGKAELYAKKYADAAATLEKLITEGGYSLYQLSEINNDYTQLFRKSTEFGKESIFEISYTSDRKNDWGNAYGDLWNDPSRTNPSNSVWQLCGPRGDQGFNGGTTGINGGWGFGYPTYSLHAAFKAAGDSVRIRANILTESQLKAAGGKLRRVVDGVETDYPWGCPGMIRVKYTTWNDETSSADGAVPDLNYGTNLRIIRYSDVLLMAAEAYLNIGNQSKAFQYLSEVRSRVNLATPATITLDDIKLERRLELAFEGSRYQDLCRWGDAETVLKDQGKSIPTGKFVNGVMQFQSNPSAGFKPKNYLFPIPFNEISANPKIEQNPGY